MQIDQFESEVESLSVQTRKKKGDKDVSGECGPPEAPPEPPRPLETLLSPRRHP